ncbi:MAG: hypothetical protein IKU68_05525 [Oscillospiraceae bacterium]|nr:hypothetical protein [Oscillospiraceae bacterium]
MAKLPNCPKCNSNAYITDNGVDSYIRQHLHSYYCELCKHNFSVPMGPKIQGDWLMTFWGAASDSKTPKRFVAVFKTPDGKLCFTKRDSVSIGSYKYTTHYRIPTVKPRNEYNVMFPTRELQVDGMDFYRIDFCPELKQEVMQNPFMKDTFGKFGLESGVCHNFKCNHDNIALGRAQYLQSILNRYQPGGAPAAAGPLPMWLRTALLVFAFALGIVFLVIFFGFLLN